jgi:hypothetical protein
MARRELRCSVLLLVLVATVFLVATKFANGSGPPPSLSSEGQQIGKILSVRKVLDNRYFVPRYPQIHYYMLYFAIRVSDKTYCSEYETPVLDEVDDLFSAKDKDVEFAQGQRPHAQNTARAENQGSPGGRKAVLTARKDSDGDSGLDSAHDLSPGLVRITRHSLTRISRHNLG